MIAQEKRNLLAGNLPDNSLVLIAGRSEVIRNGDVMYPFRQYSDFLLLTGLDIPDLILVGQKESGEMQWTLYSENITDHEKLWGTSRLTHEELRNISGITSIREKEQFSKDTLSKIQSVSALFLRKERQSEEDRRLFRKLKLSSSDSKITPLDPLLSELRIIKTPEEISYIREAIRVTHEAYDTIRANIKPQMYEYEIEAIIARVYRAHHMNEAYPTIVASGKNACTLHYTHHTRQIQENDIVLIDFGAEYRGYAADITRIFPLSDMSERQKAVYAAVVSVKKYTESLIRPGVKKSDYELQVRAKMNEELEKIGLIPSLSTPEAIQRLSRKYYPHSTSHFLGLDVHDVGERDAILRTGMIITCEPGIYIPEEGIGVRLEDDILVTEFGCENLSREIPL